jgi:hypothetical protein
MRTFVLLSSIFMAAGNITAHAATVVDVNNNASNAITSVDLFNKATNGTNDPSGTSYAGVTINETYGASNPVPYSFNSGTALANSNGTFFDQTVTLTSFDDDPSNNTTIDWDQLFIKFKVTNNSPYAWSGYNLEFYNSTFTQKLGLTLLQVGGGSTTYPYFGDSLFDKQTSYGYASGSEIHFWSDTLSQLPGQTNEISLRWDWGNPGDRYHVGDTIGIRQVASPVVPIPAALPLFLSALGMLGLIRLRKLGAE